MSREAREHIEALFRQITQSLGKQDAALARSVHNAAEQQEQTRQAKLHADTIAASAAQLAIHALTDLNRIADALEQIAHKDSAGFSASFTDDYKG